MSFQFLYNLVSVKKHEQNTNLGLVESNNKINSNNSISCENINVSLVSFNNIMLSRQEKEKLVIQLLEEEKSQREISKIAKVNFTFISNIRKKVEGNNSQPTTRIQAYKMYADNERTNKSFHYTGD